VSQPGKMIKTEDIKKNMLLTTLDVTVF